MDFSVYSTDTLRILHACAKTRGYAFFKHPKSMIALREELERRTTVSVKKVVDNNKSGIIRRKRRGKIDGTQMPLM